MANFNGQENLLAFKEARLMTNIDPEHPQMVFVAIPVPYNDIEVSRDGTRAMAGIYMQETSDKYRQSCIQRRQMSGEPMDGYLPPSHTMEVRFSKEFRERALEAARRRLMTEHPEWTGMDDPQQNTDLRRAMYDAVRVRLGSLYFSEGRRGGQPSAPQQPQYQQAQGGQQWQPTGDSSDAMFQQNDDDLPF